MFAVNGIMFNHESPRRGETFVTRKFTRCVGVKAGLDVMLYMGNIDAARYWGYAPEYVDAMWRMLQQDEPADFVVASGTSLTVRDFLQFAFEHAGLDWEKHVKFDDRYLRPTEGDSLIGDPSKAAETLRWKPDVHAAGACMHHGRRRPSVDFARRELRIVHYYRAAVVGRSGGTVAIGVRQRVASASGCESVVLHGHTGQPQEDCASSHSVRQIGHHRQTAAPLLHRHLGRGGILVIHDLLTRGLALVDKDRRPHVMLRGYDYQGASKSLQILVDELGLKTSSRSGGEWMAMNR